MAFSHAMIVECDTVWYAKCQGVLESQTIRKYHLIKDLLRILFSLLTLLYNKSFRLDIILN